MLERQTAHLAAYLILIKEDKVLLLRRFNTGWKDGWYTIPAGHVDNNESIVTSMAREATEECGISVKDEDLTMVHVLHINTDKDYVAFFFKAEKWEGEPQLVEPDKSDDVVWFDLNELPEKTLPFVKEVIHDYQHGIIFSEKLSIEDTKGGEKDE